MDENKGEVLIYQSEDGLTNVEVTVRDETVWLSQQQMAELFQTSRTNVVEHIKHIFAEGELEEVSTCRNFRQVRKEGARQVTREIPYYNLDMIISLGYRIKSLIATRFRKWATEIVFERADAQKPFMGLTSFSGELPALKDIGIAKNYLKEDELKILNNLVSGYFDLAEINAIEHRPMYMNDYVEQLDSVLSSGNRKILSDSGRVSHAQAMKKAKEEYQKYQAITISPVEGAYLKTVKMAAKAAKQASRKTNPEGR